MITEDDKLEMQKPTFLEIAVVVIVSVTGATSRSEEYRNDANLLQSIFGKTGQENDEVDTRNKRQITDDPGPFGIRGRIVGDHMAENPESAKFEGIINGELKSPIFSQPLVKITDGSDPIEVQGSVYGSLVLPKSISADDIHQQAGKIQAKVSLVLELKTVADEPEQISITGRWDGDMEIKPGEMTQLASITEFDKVPIYGWLYGEIVFTAKPRDAKDGL